MTMTVYRSSDVGAPPLRGATPGDVINLMEKCLVTGYGSKPGSGWTKPFVGTNKAVFQQGAGSNGMFLRVDDADATQNTNRRTWVVGYENMTDVDTGTPDSFPTNVQQPGGLKIFTQSYNADYANARPWMLLADSKRFLLLYSADSSPQKPVGRYARAFFFGDLLRAAGDTFGTVIRASGYSSGNPGNSQFFSYNDYYDYGYAARAIQGLGGSREVFFFPESRFTDASYWGQGSLPYPNPSDGALYLSRVTEYSAATGLRGRWPGVWASCVQLYNYMPIGTEFDGTGDLAGRRFFYFGDYDDTGVRGALIEISDTWEI